MLAAALIVIVSAAVAGTLFHKTGAYPLLDRFGLLPFAAFVVAPVVFRTERQRRILLMTLVAARRLSRRHGADRVRRADVLVFPRYILDPALMTHEDVPAGRSSRPRRTALRCTPAERRR